MGDTKPKRIKLRLHPQDLDLIALKQYSSSVFVTIFNDALKEYIDKGYCTSVEIPETTCPTKVTNELIMIPLKHPEISDWLLSIPQGLRSGAAKAIMRSAITNPAVKHFVGFDMSLTKVTDSPKKKEFSKESISSSQPSVASTYNEKPSSYNNTFDDDDLFIDDMLIGNY